MEALKDKWADERIVLKDSKLLATNIVTYSSGEACRTKYDNTTRPQKKVVKAGVSELTELRWKANSSDSKTFP